MREEREREREREREIERERGERASPTRFLLRRAPKMLPACDRTTAHYCEAIRRRGGERNNAKMREDAQTQAAGGEEGECVCVRSERSKQKDHFFVIDFLVTLEKGWKVHK